VSNWPCLIVSNIFQIYILSDQFKCIKGSITTYSHFHPNVTHLFVLLYCSLYSHILILTVHFFGTRQNQFYKSFIPCNRLCSISLTSQSSVNKSSILISPRFHCWNLLYIKQNMICIFQLILSSMVIWGIFAVYRIEFETPLHQAHSITEFLGTRSSLSDNLLRTPHVGCLKT